MGIEEYHSQQRSMHPGGGRPIVDVGEQIDI